MSCWRRPNPQPLGNAEGMRANAYKGRRSSDSWIRGSCGIRWIKFKATSSRSNQQQGAQVLY